MASQHSPSVRCPARAPALGVAALLGVVLMALGACSPVSGAIHQPDPGIAADLAVVRARTDALFQELDGNASRPFSQYDAIYYRPLKEMVGESQRLAKIHDRSESERAALDRLAQTYDEMRTLHSQGRLSYDNLHSLRARLNKELDALMAMEQS